MASAPEISFVTFLGIGINPPGVGGVRSMSLRVPPSKPSKGSLSGSSSELRIECSIPCSTP